MLPLQGYKSPSSFPSPLVSPPRIAVTVNPPPQINQPSPCSCAADLRSPFSLNNPTQAHITFHYHLLQPNLEFVLIQDSGKVVSDQDSLDSESLSEIRTLVGQQLELSRTVVRLKPDTEVFIGSLPPRYDTAAHTQLAEAYNDIMVVESFLDERITIVSQKGMHTKEMRKVRERFSDDGNMLTKYGTHLMLKNIWRQMSDKISGLRVEHNKNKRRFGKYKFKTKRLPEAIFT